MRAVVQRVRRAAVTVVGDGLGDGLGGEVVGEIGPGLCVLVGVTHDDDIAVARRMADKLWTLRILDDDDGVMNRSIAETTAGAGHGILVVSQFTLYGDTSRGRRPSWIAAARPEHAEPLIDAVVTRLRELAQDGDVRVATGRFRTEMRVEIVNDGPVTLVIDL